MRKWQTHNKEVKTAGKMTITWHRGEGGNRKWHSTEVVAAGVSRLVLDFNVLPYWSLLCYAAGTGKNEKHTCTKVNATGLRKAHARKLMQQDLERHMHES